MQKIIWGFKNSTVFQITLGVFVLSLFYIPFKMFMLPSMNGLQTVSGIVEDIAHKTNKAKDYRGEDVSAIFEVKIKKADNSDIIFYLPGYDISKYRVSAILQKPVTFRFANVKDVYEIEADKKPVLVYETILRGRLSEIKIKGITFIFIGVIGLLFGLWHLRKTMRLFDTQNMKNTS